MPTATRPASRRRRRPIRQRSASTNSAICSPARTACAKCSPTGWLDGKDTAGSHGGAAASEAAGRVDRIFGAILDFGDHARGVQLRRAAARLDQRPRACRRARRLQLRRSGNPARRRADRFARCATATSSASRSPTPTANIASPASRPASTRSASISRPQYYDGGERVGTVGGAQARCAGRVQHLHRHQHHVRTSMRFSTTSAKRSA